MNRQKVIIAVLGVLLLSSVAIGFYSYLGDRD